MAETIGGRQIAPPVDLEAGVGGCAVRSSYADRLIMPKLQSSRVNLESVRHIVLFLPGIARR
jgi:hypothetical protein